MMNSQKSLSECFFGGAFIKLTDQKGWDVRDIVMEHEQIRVSAR